MLWLLLLQRYILLLAEGRTLSPLLFLPPLLPLLLLKGDILSWVNADIVLISLHVLLSLVETHIILAPEVLEDPLCFEVHSGSLLAPHDLVNAGDGLAVFLSEEDGLCAELTLLKRVAEASLGLSLRLGEAAVLDAVAEGVCEVHVVAGEEGEAVPLCEEELVEGGAMRGGEVEVVGAGDVLAFVEVEEGESEL